MNTATQQPEEEAMTPAQALDMLWMAYNVFKSATPNKSRTFMSTAQDMLGPEISARGIVATYNMDFYKYLKQHFVNPDSDKNAVAVYGLDKVIALLEALNEIICANPELKKTVDSLLANDPAKPTTDFEKAIAEVASEVAADLGAPTIAAAAAVAHETKEALEVAVIEQPPVTEKPTHGLLLDIDAVIRQSAMNFLLSDSAGIRTDIEAKLKANLLGNTLVVLPGVKVQEEIKKQVIVKGRLHKEFKEALEVAVIEQQIFLGGPTGSGKTILAGQIAEALELPFAHISCTEGMSEAHLLGRMLADGTYVSTEFVECYENGGVFLADEVDAADANTLLILNSALANGIISLPNRKDKPRAKRHKNFYFVCAANTWGKGVGDYAGRNQLDAAFMDRFAYSKIEVSYDIELERDILKDFPEVAKRLWQMRDRMKENKVKQNLSTRAFAGMLRNFAAGRTEQQALSRFLTGWTEQELKKVLSEQE